MALETESRLVCDRCHYFSESFDRSLYTFTMMFRELRKAGWIRMRGGRLHDAGDRCPNCNPNRKVSE